ncbi:MAG: DUF4129 domain-containing protein [Cellulomonas sp.]
MRASLLGLGAATALTSASSRAVHLMVNDVPVTPDAETARRWAERELTDPIYHPAFNLLGWIMEKLNALLRGLNDAAQTVTWVQVVATLLAVALVIVALYVAGPVRMRAAAGRNGSHVVLGDDARSARELRQAAERAAETGDLDGAVLNGYRAVVRSLEERAVLAERPGRTAHEASEEAAARFPALAERLHQAGRTFDDVCYGHTPAVRTDHDELRALDGDLAQARPESVGPALVLAAPR